LVLGIFVCQDEENQLLDAVRELRFCALAAPIITVPHDAQDNLMGKTRSWIARNYPPGMGEKEAHPLQFPLHW